MELISKIIKGFHFLSCAIDIFSNYAWVIPLKDEKGITTTNAFQKVLDEANNNPNKIWVDKRREFYKRSVKSRLQDNDIEIYSVSYERKHVTEIFIRTLKNKISKYMTSVSKNKYIDKSDEISSGKQSHLTHFRIGNKGIFKNLYHDTFLANF